MTYGFYADSMGGQFGWCRWRNRIPREAWPQWMVFRHRDLWGIVTWGSPLSERTYAELVAISQDLGMYG